MREDIILDFIVNDDQLVAALDRLEKSGAIDSRLAHDFKAIGTASKTAGTEVKGLVKTFSDVKGAASVMGKSVKQAFDQGVTDALKKAGVTVEEFQHALKSAVDPTKSLTFQVLELVKGFQKGALPAKLLEDKILELKTALQNSQGAADTARAGILGLKESLTKTSPPTNKLNKDVTLLEDSLKKANDTTKTLEQQIQLLKDALNKTPQSAKSLKAELMALKEALTAAKLSGKDTGTEFEALKAKAGKLQDAIRDAGAEIKNAGSDTRQLDNIVGSISAVAGGFSAATGASALFGGQSEDLQKALLKVNGALALSSGLQQVSNALTKEGSLTKLADATATGFQSAAQTIYTAVTGKATAATFAFKAALAATGIGIVIGLVLALVNAFSDYDSEVAQAKRATDDLTASLERQQKVLALQISNIKFAGDLALEKAKQRGASEKELNALSLKNLNDQIKATDELVNKGGKDLENIAKRKAQVEKDFINSSTISQIKANKKLLEELTKQEDIYRKTREENFESSIKLGQELTLQSEQGKTEEYKKGIEDRKKAQDKADADAKKRLQELRDARLAQLNDELAAIEIRRLKIEQGSQGEIDIQKEIIRKKLQIDLEGEKLTINQKKLLQAKALDDQLKLQTEFNSLQTKEAIQGLISRNNAELAQIGINGEEKLRLTIENIQAAAQIEREANLNNASKLLEINAKAAGDIRAVRLAFSEKTLEDEISLNTLRTGAAHRALEAMAQDEKQSAEKRIAAIQSILTEDSRVINQRILNLEDQLAGNLISEQEYNLKLAKLIDDRVKIQENAASRENEINTKSIKDREDKEKEAIERILATASQVSGLLNQLSQLASANETERIEGMKRELQELEEAGAITKKNAEIRAKQIEIAERQAKQRQAKRNKELALFEAVINTARAIAEASPNPFLIALAAALGAAQIALIAARPIPKFAKGKKDSYEGPGVVGEAGTELVERNGKMYITTKPTVMYLGKKDKVFNPSETKVMMHNSRLIDQPKPTSLSIDYDKLGKVMSKNKSDTSINIDRDFISESVANGLNKNNYFNNRYKF